ncbi:MAG: hypothetical protein U0V75_14485 [Ferruginibacter sp.]
MKIILSSLVMAILFASCDKCKIESSCIPARILRYDCDRVILQLQSSQQIGDSSWTDVQTGTRYTNVVWYDNTCLVSAVTGGQKQTIFVTLGKTEDTDQSGCMECTAVSANPPVTRVYFKNISRDTCIAGVQE